MQRIYRSRGDRAHLDMLMEASRKSIKFGGVPESHAAPWGSDLKLPVR